MAENGLSGEYGNGLYRTHCIHMVRNCVPVDKSNHALVANSAARDGRRYEFETSPLQEPTKVPGPYVRCQTR